MDTKTFKVVGLDGKEHTNIEFETIKEWYHNKLLNENSLIFSAADGQWQKLKNVFNISEFNVGRYAQPPQNFQFQQTFNQPPFNHPNPNFQPQNFQNNPQKRSPVLKIILGVVGVFLVVSFGLVGLGAYVAVNVTPYKQSAEGNEKALAELKKYEIPGSEFVDQKSGAKALLPKDWRMISLDNPIIYIANQKEGSKELQKLNLSENTMLATDKTAGKMLLLEIINFPQGIDRAKFFEESARLVENEIKNGAKPGTYNKLNEFSTILANGLAKKIIFERVSNASNPNASEFGMTNANKVYKGQMVVMSNDNNAFIFQMWTEKDDYDAAVSDFAFIEKNFSMPKDIIK